MDIGQPKDFIIGTGLYLEHLKMSQSEKLATGEGFVGEVLVVSIILYIHSLSRTGIHVYVRTWMILVREGN